MASRVVLISLVGLTLLGAAAHVMAPQVLAQQTIALGAPKWEVGDQWVWQIGNDQVTWTVLSADGEYAVQQKSDRETGIIHIAADLSSTRESSSYFLPPFFQLQFPLTLGRRWTYRMRGLFGLAGGELEFEVTRMTEGVVSITVPAGTFDAVRIFGRTRALNRPSTSTGFTGTTGTLPSGDFVVWYAPKVKQLARITWQSVGPGSWRPEYNGSSLLLVSYKLHNP